MLPRFTFTLSWILWCGVIVAVVFPWHDLHDHTHWAKVAWIPFVSPPLKATDIVGNVLLYIPLGFLAARGARTQDSRLGRLEWAALLSILTESSQLFSHYRFPSATDVTCNMMGYVAGLQLARAPSWRALFTFPQETSL